MFAGFDYGSANCALALWEEGSVKMLPIGDQGSDYLMSVVYALDVSFITEALVARLPKEKATELAANRSAELARARRMRSELDLLAGDDTVFIGEAALSAYLETPEEGFFVRSPKSFLGATGLRAEQEALFEDIVTLMMLEVKTRADKLLGGAGPLSRAVIGRPVNFQGIGGDAANRQAERILRTAAGRAGFKDVHFLFEPLAAAFDYEAKLDSDSRVLVVDVGGGTTDCSLVQMGPSRRDISDRSDDCLGHSGQRIGGNDLDIALAMECLMPHYGLGSELLTGKPMPRQTFWQAVAINDVGAQREFFSLGYATLLKELKKDAKDSAPLTRLEKLRRDQQHYQLVKAAELGKIALSDAIQTQVIHPDGDPSDIGRDDFDAAISPLMGRIEALMLAAVGDQGAPEVIYVTGGSSRCPSVASRIAAVYPEVPVVYGDHFGSVTSGLARRAALIFAD